MAVELKVWLTVVPPPTGDADTKYPVRVPVPGSVGAVQLAVICPLAPVPVTPVGAPGNALHVKPTLPGHPAHAPEIPLAVAPLPPAPLVAPVVPCAVCSPQDFEVTALPAVKVGLDPLLKLVRREVDTQDDPDPPPPAPSAGRKVQPLDAPLPPP